jgi:arylsulfatase A-like enzyme
MKLDELFEKMDHARLFDNAVIVIHGDHGSRIVKREPTIENEHELSREDIVDAYSTLFAVKFPKQVASYDTQPYPIEFLLQEKVVNTLLGENGKLALPDPFVFLRSEDQKILDLKPIPYPMTH